MRKISLFLLFLISGISNRIGFCQSEAVKITVDLAKEIGQIKPSWAWFGYDEPNYTYMKDGKKLLSELSALSPVPVFIRAHNLLTTGDGTPALKWGSTDVYTEDESGHPVYNWTIIDKIFDTYVERGMKPLVEMGFMPEALSSNPQPYRHNWKPGDPYDDIYTGWRYPPKDYNKWAELIYQWVKHSKERYGTGQVESWYWELWNEPDAKYWGGTVDEYCKLYDFSSDAVKRALPSARVGGPHVTAPAGLKASEFLTRFLNHCDTGINQVTGKRGAPLDFIAFHAKGSPRFIEGRVRMNMGTQLKSVSRGFEIVSSIPKFKDLPIIIGECDPEGCAACGMTVYPQNGYRNGTMYSSYTASSFSKIFDLALYYKINLLGIVTWAFEFEDQPWFHGYRDLATNGVDKPVLNVFRMFGMMKGMRVEAFSDNGFSFNHVIDSGVRSEQADIGVFAGRDKKEATIMVWNYHDDDLAAADATVDLEIRSVPVKKITVMEYRIDRDHSNSFEVWKKLGSPQDPSAEQIKELEEAGDLQLACNPEKLKVRNNSLTIPVSMPRQGVSLFKIEWE